MANPLLMNEFELKNFKKRSDLHLARKLWHVGTVFSMFLFYRLFPESISHWVLGLAWAIFVPLDFVRIKNKSVNDFFIHFFRPIIRSNEVHKLAGTTYLLTGVALLVLFFPEPVVSLALLFLAFADPMASYFGIRFGRDKVFGQKTIQGFFAAFVVCWICSFLFMLDSGAPRDRLIVFSLLAALVGSLAELIPIGKLDDNLTLPLISGAGLFILYSAFGFLELPV